MYFHSWSMYLLIVHWKKAITSVLAGNQYFSVVLRIGNYVSMHFSSFLPLFVRVPSSWLRRPKKSWMLAHQRPFSLKRYWKRKDWEWASGERYKAAHVRSLIFVRSQVPVDLKFPKPRTSRLISGLLITLYGVGPSNLCIDFIPLSFLFRPTTILSSRFSSD